MAHYHAKLKYISCKIEFVYVFNPNSSYFRTIEKNNYVLNSQLIEYRVQLAFNYLGLIKLLVEV